MQLRTKIIALFMLITALAVGSVTLYSAYNQRNSYITTELETQKQVLSLLHNAVSVQFYSFTYEQLQSSITIRRELKNKALTLHERIGRLKRSIEQLYGVNLYHLPTLNDRNSWTEQERQAELTLHNYLSYEQQIMAQQDTDLVVTRGNELFVAPRNQLILTGLAVSLSHLLPIMHSSTSEYHSGYFLTLFNSSRTQSASQDNLGQLTAASTTPRIDPEILDYFGFVESQLAQNDTSTELNQGRLLPPAQDTYSLQLALQAKGAPEQERNFSSYIYKNDSSSPYTYALVAGVDNILEQYHDLQGQVLLRLQPNIKRLHELLASEMLIVDTNGRVHASSAPVPLFAQASSELLSFCSREAQAQLDYKRCYGAQYERNYDEFETPIVTIDGRDYVVGSIYFKPLDWYIVNLLPYEVITGPAYRNALVLLGIGATILLLSLACGVWFSSRLIAPLRRIAAKAHVIATTDLSDAAAVREISASLNFKGKDEISALGHAFARMGDSLSTNLAATMKITAQKSRMESELNMARTIQLGMLPEHLPVSALLTHDATSHPAKEVGGDFFDIFRRDQHHMVYTIGDVSDKGVPAALFMSTTMTLARTCLYQNMSAAATMGVINERLSERNPNLMFVTMLIAIVDERDGSVDWCNAGHCPPILIKADGTYQELTQIDGPAVGPMEGMVYHSQHFKLEPGTLILCYTDGVSEAQNSKGEFFGTARIKELCAPMGPHQLITQVESAVADFRGIAAQSDDITMLAWAWQQKPGAQAPDAQDQGTQDLEAPDLGSQNLEAPAPDQRAPAPKVQQ